MLPQVRVRAGFKAEPRVRGDLRRLNEVVTTALQEAGRQSIELLVMDARERAPVGRGALRSTIHGLVHVTPRQVELELVAGGPGVPQARWMEYGTGTRSEDPDSPRQPIVILPRRRGVLHWQDRLTGRDIFARRVIQQGLEPRSYLRSTIEDNTDEVVAIFARTIADALMGHFSR